MWNHPRDLFVNILNVGGRVLRLTDEPVRRGIVYRSMSQGWSAGITGYDVNGDNQQLGELGNAVLANKISSQ